MGLHKRLLEDYFIYITFYDSILFCFIFLLHLVQKWQIKN